jgi:hypothetical protein
MSIIKSLPVSTFKRLDHLKRETAKDENLQKLMLFIRERPDDKRTIPCAVKPYLTHQDEISEAEGIMLRGSMLRGSRIHHEEPDTRRASRAQA